MSLSHVCWCCLLRPSEKDLTKSYLNYGITETYSEMLIECFQIHITEGHEGVCGICEVCVRRLRDARDFKLQVQCCQKELRRRLGEELLVKDEKPDIQPVEMAIKHKTTDWPMLHEEITIKPDIVDQGGPINQIFREPEVMPKSTEYLSSSNHTTQSETHQIKTEVLENVVAEANMSHDEPPVESEMSDNEMSDADLMLHEPDVDIATAPDNEDPDKVDNENLPTRSKDRYVATYESFIVWKNEKNTSSFSENVLLAYFEEIAAKYKPTSLWAIYSMLKKTLKSNHCINMEDYAQLSAYLRKKSDGYVSKKTKVLTAEDVDKFIDEAPDEKYLATKVALIFGVTGALRREDLAKITTDHIENHNEVLLVKFPHTRNKIPRSFVIEGKYFNVVKKYQKLRSHKGTDTRFFQQYRNGKCTAQGIGKNKFGSMPKEVAAWLGLEDAKSYTGHSFRRTSASLNYFK